MADLTVTAANVSLVDPLNALTDKMISAVAITAGQAVYKDANGKADLADASAAGTAGARGIALESVAANEALTIVREGKVAGFTLTSQAYDAPIFLSDTAGALADAAGTVSVAAGNVDNSTDQSLTKYLFVRFPVGN